MKKRTKHRGAPLLVATAVLTGLILFLGSGPVWAGDLCLIGDYVWKDANGNGCQDVGPNEYGLQGVKVTLIKYSDKNCGTQTETEFTKTNANGYYEFAVDCDKSYIVQFGDVEEYVRTTANSMDCQDDKDSDCSMDDGKTGCITFPNPANERENFTIDCGYVVCDGVIGDYVWLDENGNGCQDEVNTGIADVYVTLSEDCSDRENPKTVKTDSDGYYEFTGLCPGEYFVEFGNGRPNTNPGQPCGDNGDSKENDSDCGDPNLQCVTLDSNNIVDNTIDCGKVNPCQLVVEKVAVPETIDCIDTGTDGAVDDDCICPCVDSGTDTGTDGDPACIVKKVTYTYKITNNGIVTLSNVTVFDDKLGQILVEFTELAPGASETVKVEDVCLCEETTNKVTVTGKLPNGELCTAMDEATVTTELDCIDTGTDGY